MPRIRLNQEYRNKVNSRMRVHLEAEDTQERKKYDDLKADQLEIVRLFFRITPYQQFFDLY